jgi:hypothetical protein
MKTCWHCKTEYDELGRWKVCPNCFLPDNEQGNQRCMGCRRPLPLFTLVIHSPIKVPVELEVMKSAQTANNDLCFCFPPIDGDCTNARQRVLKILSTPVAPG